MVGDGCEGEEEDEVLEDLGHDDFYRFRVPR